MARATGAQMRHEPAHARHGAGDHFADQLERQPRAGPASDPPQFPADKSGSLYPPTNGITSASSSQSARTINGSPSRSFRFMQSLRREGAETRLIRLQSDEGFDATATLSQRKAIVIQYMLKEIVTKMTTR